MNELRRRQILSAIGGGLVGAFSLTAGVDLAVSRSRLPRNGTLDPAFQRVEDVVLEYLVEHNVSAAALGIAVGGEVRVERAYGWFGQDRTAPLSTDALFRVASVSKVFTRATVRRLVSEGSLAYDDAVLERLEVDLPPDLDPRLRKITVEHLLSHQAGWDRTADIDPMFATRRIANDLGLGRAPTRREMVEWTLARPLQYHPGQREVYSNVGYAVLGTLVEDVTGMDYQAYVRDRVLEPAGVTDVALAHARPAERPAREVRYESNRWCLDAVDVDALLPVRCPDGGFHLEAMDASGGHVATAGALLGFMKDYWLTGHPRGGDVPRISLQRGDLPGTFAYVDQLRPRRDVVVLTNRVANDENAFLRDLQTAISGAIGQSR